MYIIYEFLNWSIITSIIIVFLFCEFITILGARYNNFFINIFVPEVRKRINDYSLWFIKDYQNTQSEKFRSIFRLLNLPKVILPIYMVIAINYNTNPKDVYNLFTFKFVSKRIMEQMLEEPLKLKQIRALNNKEMNILIQKVISSAISTNILGVILIYYFILSILIFLILFFINYT